MNRYLLLYNHISTQKVKRISEIQKKIIIIKINKFIKLKLEPITIVIKLIPNKIT